MSELIDDFRQWCIDHPEMRHDTSQCYDMREGWGGSTPGTGGWNKGIHESEYKSYEPHKYSRPGSTPWNKDKSGYKNSTYKPNRVRLTDEQISFIKENRHIATSVLARRFGVHRQTIWSHRRIS